MIARCAILTTCLLAMNAHADNAGVAATGLQTNITFNDYSPLSRTSQMARRLFSPLQAWRVNRAIALRGDVREQAVDLSQEKFAVYVPSAIPAAGYALLVFVPPWERAAVPERWVAELDRHGMIFVSAANSGNDTSMLDRREPLALLAAHNIIQRYPVDANRVYVGGFSGGSRVAMRLALGYSDLFRGALLNAGSDPIGDTQISLPPAELMHRFQESTRLVYLTGKDDAIRLEMDVQSRRSMQDWCVFDIKTLIVTWSGHEASSAAAFNQGLEALEAHEKVDSERLAACRRSYTQSLDDELHVAERLLASGDAAEARKALEKIDARYGGLAAPRSIELAQKLDGGQ